MPLIVNDLVIIRSGIFAGVLLATGVLLGGYWQGSSAVTFLYSFTTFLPLVPCAIAFGVVAVVGLVGSIWLSWRKGGSYVVVASGRRYRYFIYSYCRLVGSTNRQFSTRSLAFDRVLAKRGIWLKLHGFCIVLAVLASVLGIITFSH